MTAFWIFAFTFLLVFVFGFITSAGYKVAFLTTFAIGVGYLVVFHFLPVITPLEVMAYLFGGPSGIVASLAVQRTCNQAIDELCELQPLTEGELGQVGAADKLYSDRAPWRSR